MEKHIQALAWDFLRHNFSGRELRILLAILFRLDGTGKASLEWRRFFDDRLGLRSDKALEILRELQRARVLKPGWENGEFVIEPRSDFWKRAELAPAVVLAQAALPIESGDDGVRFAQSVARESFGVLAARASEANAEAGVLPGTSVTHSGECFPKMGRDGFDTAAAVFPQSGEKAMEPALAQAGAGFPILGKSVPHPGDCNVVQRLNVSSKEITLERCNVSCPAASGKGRRLSGDEERELIARTRGFVGEEDWQYWGGCWVKHVVRKIPEILERALADRECQVREGRSIRHRGKALWYACQEFGADPKALCGG